MSKVHLCNRDQFQDDDTLTMICGRQGVERCQSLARYHHDKPESIAEFCLQCVRHAPPAPVTELEVVVEHPVEPTAAPTTVAEVPAALDTLPTFAARTAYCDANLQRIGKGSGRAVYALDDSTVLKLATNKKGVAQNEVEADWMLAKMYGSLVAECTVRDSESRWLVAERASKAKEADFKRTFGLPAREVFYYIGYRMYAAQYYKPERRANADQLDENETMQSTLNLIVNFGLIHQDITHKSAWGTVGGRLVLVDYGCTESVYRDYYRKGNVKGGQI